MPCIPGIAAAPIAAGSLPGIAAAPPSAGAVEAGVSLAASSPPPHPAVIRIIAGRKASTNNRRKGDRVAEMTTEFSNRGTVFLLTGSVAERKQTPSGFQAVPREQLVIGFRILSGIAGRTRFPY
jgi:hypothetical protein